MTTEQFIAKARLVHGDRYDYTLTEYVGTHSPVKIICDQHGVFMQPPSVHASKKACGCPSCGKDISRTVNNITSIDFITKAKHIHGDRYDYSMVKYINNYTPVTITCPQHGTFSQRPFNHLYDRYGCKECGNKSKGSASFLKSRHNTALVYIVKMSALGEVFGKVGITTKQDALHRFKSCVYDVEVINQAGFNIDDAIELERILKKKIKYVSYTPNQRFDGYTECFWWSTATVNDLLLEYNI